MAIITANGRINIDLVDVWSWLTNIAPEITEEEGLHLSYRSDSDEPGLLVTGEKASHLVDAVEFWIWVQDHHSPVDDPDGLTFGVPEVHEDGLIIDFTLNTEPAWPTSDKPKGEKRLRLYTDEFVGEQNPGYQAEVLAWELTAKDILEVLPALVNDAISIHRHSSSPVSAARCALGTVKLYRKLDHHLSESGFESMTALDFSRFADSDQAHRACLLHCEQHHVLVRPGADPTLNIAFAEKFAPYMECATSLEANRLIEAIIAGEPGDEIGGLPQDWKAVVV